jgi:hypothetical protein
MSIGTLIALLLLPGQVPALTPEQQRRFEKEEQNRKNALELIDEWPITTQPTKWNCAPSEYAARLKELVKTPALLSQGGYPWCMYASCLYLLLVRDAFTVARYALALYQTGNDAKLGTFTAKVSTTLLNFDVVKYGNREIADNLPPNNKRISIEQRTDWILLAGLCGGTNHAVPVTGSFFDGTIEEADDEADEEDTAKTILQKSLVYKTGGVTVTEIKSDTPNADILNLITPSSDCDVILIAPLAKYFLGGAQIGAAVPPIVGNCHAAPILSRTGDTLTYWSWGKNAVTSAGILAQNQTVTVDRETGFCQVAVRLNVLKPSFGSLDGNRYAIRAPLDPLPS